MATTEERHLAGLVNKCRTVIWSYLFHLLAATHAMGAAFHRARDALRSLRLRDLLMFNTPEHTAEWAEDQERTIELLAIARTKGHEGRLGAIGALGAIGGDTVKEALEAIQ